MSETDTHGDEPIRLHGLPPVLLLFVVCAAGIAVGALFGSIFGSFGALFGGLGGAVAGILWTRILLKRARAGYGRSRLAGAGAGWGFVVGLIATAILHGGRILGESVRQGRFTRIDAASVLIIGAVAVLCAVVGGVITGALCGLIVPKRKRT
jgi:hypothetical protein